MANIVVDPGHGGSSNIGGSSWNNAVGPNGTLEKRLTLDVGNRLFSTLRLRGHSVWMTRDGDNNLGLATRAKLSKQKDAKVFVSLHFNGSTNHNAQGTETLVHTHYSSLSAELSIAIQDALLVITKLKDRNLSYSPSRIKPQSLGVLRPSRHRKSAAACLVEVSFLDRANEEERLQNAGYLSQISDAIADGVEAYLGTSLASVDTDAGEVGDSIETSAIASNVSPVDFLGLNEVDGVLDDREEADEKEGMPPVVFSSAFVNGGMNDDVLFTSDDDYLDEFKSFLAPLNLRWFSADEFLFLGNSNNGSGNCAGKNARPPKSLWNNIGATAQMIDEIREQMGASIRILSGYRNQTYNSCIGGKANSFHKQFLALDFVCSVGTPEIWRRVAVHIRNSDIKFKGGIGKYISQNFLHIDTRGTNANWIKP